MAFERSPDRLRAIAAEMALLAPEDVEAILDDLPLPQRHHLHTLIMEFGSVGRSPVSHVQRTLMPPAFSDWLAERLGDREHGSASLTPHTRTTLLDLSARIPSSDTDVGLMASRTGSLFQRLLAKGHGR